MRFDRFAAITALLLTIALIWLATQGARLGWLREQGGDVLAVVWLYYVLKSAVRAAPMTLAACAFGVGALVEAGQFLTSRYDIVIPYRALRIVFGSTPDWLDVVAYAAGALAVLIIEHGVHWLRQRAW